MEFVKLPKPIKVKYEFDEIFVSPDIYFNYFTTVTESVPNVTLFAIREFLQNAIDQIIIETKDYEHAYEKVKVEYQNGWYIIRSPGIIPEDAFALGFTTKKTVELPYPCCLIGHFGVGMKQAMGALILKGKEVYINTGGHIYTFAGYCDNEIKTKDITVGCKLAILRGKSPIGKMTVVEMQGEPLSINVLWNHKTRVWHEGRAVYHNGMYSGDWGLPFSVNLCCVEADEYRTKIAISSTSTGRAFATLVQTLTKEEKEEMIKGIIESYRIVNRTFFFDFPKDYVIYFNLIKDIVAEAVKMLAEANKISPIVISNELTADLPTGAFVFDTYSSMSIKYVVDRLKILGIEAYTYDEWKKKTELDEMIKNSYKPEELPRPILSGILAGKWMFNVALYGFTGLAEYICLDDKIMNTPIYVLKDSYPYQPSTELGVTIHRDEKDYIFLSPPRIIKSSSLSRLAENEDEMLKYAYTFITFHELIHAKFPEYEHGTVEFEMPYLMMIKYFEKINGLHIFAHNIMNLAYYAPELLEGVECVHGLDYLFFEPRIFVELNKTRILDIDVSGDRVYLAVPSTANALLKVEKEDNVLEFKIEYKD